MPRHSIGERGQGALTVSIGVKTGTEVEGIALAYREYGCRLREIAEHLGVHHATVSRRLRKFERAQGPNPAV